MSMILTQRVEANREIKQHRRAQALVTSMVHHSPFPAVEAHAPGSIVRCLPPRTIHWLL